MGHLDAAIRAKPTLVAIGQVRGQVARCPEADVDTMLFLDQLDECVGQYFSRFDINAGDGREGDSDGDLPEPTKVSSDTITGDIITGDITGDTNGGPKATAPPGDSHADENSVSAKVLKINAATK